VIRLYGLLFLVDLALLVIALIDCLSTDEFAVRNLPKVVWVFLIVLFSPIGAIVWFVAGRPQKAATGRAGAWRPGSGFPERERPRPVAPDDDPEFLRNADRVAEEARRDDAELFAKWEDDLRRREEQLRRREDGEDKAG
jgi:hypothetical protein